MTWNDIAPDDGNDGAPVDAATLKDVIRFDIIALMDNSPMCIPAHPILNTPRVVPRTGADAATVDFAHRESVFVRFNFFYVRAGYKRQLRNLRVAMWAATSANTGSLRAVWSPSYEMPDDPPTRPRRYVDGAAGAVTTTPAWHELVIALDPEANRRTSMGREPIANGGGDLFYPVGHLTLQGRMLAAGNLTVSRLSGHEVAT